MRLGDLISADFDRDCHCGIPIWNNELDMCPDCAAANCKLPDGKLFKRVYCVLSLPRQTKIKGGRGQAYKQRRPQQAA
jgi:hypothetical protein